MPTPAPTSRRARTRAAGATAGRRGRARWWCRPPAPAGVVGIEDHAPAADRHGGQRPGHDPAPSATSAKLFTTRPSADRRGGRRARMASVLPGEAVRATGEPGASLRQVLLDLVERGSGARPRTALPVRRRRPHPDLATPRRACSGYQARPSPTLEVRSSAAALVAGEGTGRRSGRVRGPGTPAPGVLDRIAQWSARRGRPYRRSPRRDWGRAVDEHPGRPVHAFPRRCRGSWRGSAPPSACRTRGRAVEVPSSPRPSQSVRLDTVVRTHGTMATPSSPRRTAPASKRGSRASSTSWAEAARGPPSCAQACWSARHLVLVVRQHLDGGVDRSTGAGDFVADVAGESGAAVDALQLATIERKFATRARSRPWTYSS